MIISKTPLRISFLGGGTDYPEYFQAHGGAVLGTAIDKFAYVSVSGFHSRLFDYSIRISYRQVECVRSLDDIQHAPFRECLRWCGIERDVEVNYSAELPAFTGLGSSSAFVVGLLNALHAFKGSSVRGIALAQEAIRLERGVLREAVGCQDQTFAAMGGLNLIEFRHPMELVVHRVAISPERQRELESSLLIVYTGIQRRANDIAEAQVRRTSDNVERLRQMRRLVDKGYAALTGTGSFEDFGRLIHESWVLKCGLEPRIGAGEISRLYRNALDAGAFGGKLLGAGGGGFFLFVVAPERRDRVLAALGGAPVLDVTVNAPGSHIIHS